MGEIWIFFNSDTRWDQTSDVLKHMLSAHSFVLQFLILVKLSKTTTTHQIRTIFVFKYDKNHFNINDQIMWRSGLDSFSSYKEKNCTWYTTQLELYNFSLLAETTFCFFFLADWSFEPLTWLLTWSWSWEKKAWDERSALSIPSSCEVRQKNTSSMDVLRVCLTERRHTAWRWFRWLHGSRSQSLVWVNCFICSQ